MKKKVVLGISGGVDSAVSAVLLKEQGYDLIALFMKNWEEKDENGVCTSAQDALDAENVAYAQGIPFYTVNFEKEYWDRVFSYFLGEYKKGRTPNPDVMCNQEIKFDAFLKYAMSLDADYIAMGHYARVVHEKDKSYLLKGRDMNKDQTYFLSRIPQEALQKTLFPIGELKKEEVRRIAIEHKLVNARKKDSTGVCFIGERNFNEFLDKYLLTEAGDMVDLDSQKVVGRHTGLIHYTLGQRKGIGLGGLGDGQPWFVADKDLEKNILYIVQGKDHPALFSDYCICEDIYWISGKPDKMPYKCKAKFRYRQPDIGVKLYEDACGLRLVYDHPVKAVTPGQVAVFYDGDICLGSGIIKSRHKGKTNGS